MLVVALWCELQMHQVPSQLLCSTACAPGLHKCGTRQEFIPSCNFQNGWEKPCVATEGVSHCPARREAGQGVPCHRREVWRALHRDALLTHSTGVVGPGSSRRVRDSTPGLGLG